MPPAVAPTKNREANELRAQANTLRNELLDVTKPYTIDEVKTKTDAIRALDMRAEAAAGFTPDAEIARQGGEGTDLVRRDGIGAEVDDDPREARKQLFTESRKIMRKAFGGMDGFAKAVARGTTLNAKQAEAMDRLGAITRTFIGTAGDTSGGEFLLPLQQEASIFEVPNLQDGMLSRARRYTARGRSLRIPYLVQTNPNVQRPMAGIADIQIVGEGSTKPVAEPSFGQRLLTIYKYAAITQLGDETVADDFTGDLQPAVTGAVGGQVLNRINEDVTYDGTGSAMPLAAFNPANPAVLNVTRANANKVGTTDIFQMYSRHTMGPQSAWFISRRVIEQLFGLALATGSTVTPLVTFLPDLRGQPAMRLLGLPVILTDLLPTLGSTGDVCLGNPEFMAVAIRQELTVDSSIHYAFINDITTYRFVARAGGIPIPIGYFSYKSTVTGTSGVQVDVHSPFVVLN